MSSANRRSGQTADSYRFGAFELRGKAGLLLHHGARVRIQELPLRMLLLLVEHSGEVVSRDQLRNHLWGARTFVEFDSNLRVAAAKLREALGDNAAQPRFLETVARRGYRFIGDAVPIIEAAETADTSPSSPAEPPAVAPVAVTPVAVTPPAPSLPSIVTPSPPAFRPAGGLGSGCHRPPGNPRRPDFHTIARAAHTEAGRRGTGTLPQSYR